MTNGSLMGQFEHVIDVKGRMAFPNKLREQLGLSFIVTLGLEGCLYVYSEAEWEMFMERLNTLTGPKAKAAKRRYASSAVLVEPDKQGRILIPQNLREHAGLEHDVTVIGVINHAEIWDNAKWTEQSSIFSDEELAEALEEIDF